MTATKMKENAIKAKAKVLIRREEVEDVPKVGPEVVPDRNLRESRAKTDITDTGLEVPIREDPLLLINDGNKGLCLH